MTDRAQTVRAYLMQLQRNIATALEEEDGRGRFDVEELGDADGLTRPHVMEGGAVFEKAAVHCTHSRGDRLPDVATRARPELAGRAFEAVALSLIVHPENPYVPTTHANLRFFTTRDDGDAEPVWWFGGGFDLTPYYGFEDDAVHWHRTARDACEPFGAEVYPRFKEWCDTYFFLPHRQEPRGIGGLFFDDLNAWGFERTFAFVRSVGDHFIPAYRPIVAGRKSLAWGERQRDFQLYRRGRYVEFNLLQDRGTRYGIESGRRVESVLASLPPLVSWRYDWHPEPGTPEAQLYDAFLKPRDWAFETSSPARDG